MLLIHHLFYIQEGSYDDIYVGNYGIVHIFSLACKACVPLFIFLSGYGLAIGTKKFANVDWCAFYVKRAIKLYSNYWLMWLLFVPIGVFVFGRTFDTVYGEHILRNFTLDLFGLLNCLGTYGYNPTWWFYSCIILLYLLFPFIMTLCKTNNRWIVNIIFWLSILVYFRAFNFMSPIRPYLLPFTIGILAANMQIDSILPPPVFRNLRHGMINDNHEKVVIIMCVLAIIMCIIVRNFTKFALILDSLTAIFVVLLYKRLHFGPYTHRGLRFLGRHSFNIFLFHTFIYFFYLPQFIFWSRNPFIILITLTSFCITLSVVVEYLKEKVGFNRGMNKLINSIEQK